MIDTEGRKPFSKLGYAEIGKQVSNLNKISDFKWLDKNHTYDVPLYPQRTVVQFSSTYMELTGRQDRIRGDVTSWGLFFFSLVSYGIYGMGALYFMILPNSLPLSLIVICFILILLAILTHVLPLLSTELFTYTYLPIRFNRKTRKVYVRQANRRVEIFDWDELKFYMATTYKDGGDIRGIILADDGMTIKKMFSLPFINMLGADIYNEGSLLGHFEFVRRYMEGDDQQLEESKNAIRYIHPVHIKRETPLISLQRVKLSYYTSTVNQEYPKTFIPTVGHYAILPVAWIRYLGRLLSINTSITPHFSAEIEAECHIDPNDPHDLNKHLPEGNIEEANRPFWKTMAYSVALIVFGIVMLFAFTLFVDMIGNAKGHDSNFTGQLWDLFSFKWLS